MKTNTLFSFLVETHVSFQPTHASAMDEVRRVFPIIMSFFKAPIPLSGRVLDSVTKQPLVSNYEVEGINWRHGETRTSDPKFGRYNFFMEGGKSYNLIFSSQGYKNKTIQVNLPRNNENGIVRDILLEKN
jgi:hypothetical protein